MREPLLNIGVVVGIVVILNLLILAFKSENRYWRTPIAIWGIFTISMIAGIMIHNHQVQRLEKAYWTSAEGKTSGDYELWKELEKSRKESVKLEATLIHFVTIQTIMTFILQILGFRQTDKKRLYGSTATIFGLLTITVLYLEAIRNIVPYGIVT